MARSTDRILTTHVGSLVRPPELVEYISAIEKGLAVDMKAFDALLQKKVDEVVKRQQQAGIDIVSDGEFGKFRSWSFYVHDRLEGIEERRRRGAARGRARPEEVSRNSTPNISRPRSCPSAAPSFAWRPCATRGRRRSRRTSRSSKRR